MERGSAQSDSCLARTNMTAATISGNSNCAVCLKSRVNQFQSICGSFDITGDGKNTGSPIVSTCVSAASCLPSIVVGWSAGSGKPDFTVPTENASTHAAKPTHGQPSADSLANRANTHITIAGTVNRNHTNTIRSVIHSLNDTMPSGTWDPTRPSFTSGQKAQ